MEINNCPSCGAKIEFSPTDKALKCVKCGKIYPIKFIKNPHKKPLHDCENDDGFKEWENSSRCYQCANCGGQIILNKFEMSNRCQYCNTSSLVPLNELPGLKPSLVLPFKISKEQAGMVFKKNIKSRFLLPGEFKKNLPNIEIGASYIPSFSFGCSVYAMYHGTEQYTTTTRVNGETKVVTRSRPISGHLKHQFNNIIVEVSDKITQYHISSILPFNFNEAYDYDSAFIMGYSVGYYNQTPIDAFEEAKIMAEHEIEHMIRNKYSNSISSLSIQTNYSDENYVYSLVPIYFVNFKYKDKEYMNVMNGQNGNVGGKLPYSKVKISFLVILAILMFFGVPLLIFLLI